MRLAFYLIVILILGSSVFSQDEADSTVSADSAFINISIESKSTTYDKTLDTLTVYLNSLGVEFGGFDLKIGVDTGKLWIKEIIGGEFTESCKWEFLNFRENKKNDYHTSPVQFWSVVAMADMMTDTTKPECYSFDGKVSLFSVIIERSGNFSRLDSTASIFFYWEDCTDNTFSGKQGNDLYLSRQVINYFPINFELPANKFPNYLGDIRECLKGRSNDRIHRLIEFHSGGIQIKDSEK